MPSLTKNWSCPCFGLGRQEGKRQHKTDKIFKYLVRLNYTKLHQTMQYNVKDGMEIVDREDTWHYETFTSTTLLVYSNKLQIIM